MRLVRRRRSNDVMKVLYASKRLPVAGYRLPVIAGRTVTNAVRALVMLAVFSASAVAQSRRPMTFEDFAAMKYVSDPQLSPDGTQIVYAVRTTDLARNTRRT